MVLRIDAWKANADLPSPWADQEVRSVMIYQSVSCLTLDIACVCLNIHTHLYPIRRQQVAHWTPNRQYMWKRQRRMRGKIAISASMRKHEISLPA